MAAIAFDEPQIKQEILQLIVQYLHDEGYAASVTTVQDEANVRRLESQRLRPAIRRLRRAVIEGDWTEVEKQCGRAITGEKQQKTFLYSAYRLQYLELLDGGEHQKAFNHLTKRLKPLETCAPSPAEFRDLCYLLTCRSVQEVIREWEGAASAREELLQQHSAILELQADMQSNGGGDEGNSCLLDAPLPQRRLLTLLEQAAEMQVQQARERTLRSAPPIDSSQRHIEGMGPSRDERSSRDVWEVQTEASLGQDGSRVDMADRHGNLNRRGVQLSSLLSDYRSPLLPNAARHTFSGHTAGVKCLAWLEVGPSYQDILLASGGNDNSVRLWRLHGCGSSDTGYDVASQAPSTSGSCACILPHPSRVWALSSRRGDGSGVPLLASACADGRVRLFDAREAVASCYGGADTARMADAGVGFVSQTLGSHQGDAYSVALHAREPLCLSSGYDTTVRLYDIRTGVHLRALVGHTRAISSATFNGAGNLVVSGGKDATIRFWDLRSGLCIKTLGAPLGEVTSLDLAPNGVHLLSSSRDNSLRLWDMRSARPLRSFKGHQNTARNFVRACFMKEGSLATSGSEDGAICIWHVESGELATRLITHTDVTYEARWCDDLGLLASASHDGLVRTWAHDSTQPMQRNNVETDEPWSGSSSFT